jgi:prepilin-type N-terminal cleavage/methylation domain-containing protein
MMCKQGDNSVRRVLALRVSARRVSARRGFTLLEVLIATFIIALGSLGLLVLFAGAATQQREAARITSSAFNVGSVASILDESAGKLVLTLPPDEAGALTVAELIGSPEGQWVRMPVDPQTGEIVAAPPGQEDALAFSRQRSDPFVAYSARFAQASAFLLPGQGEYGELTFPAPQFAEQLDTREVGEFKRPFPGDELDRFGDLPSVKVVTNTPPTVPGGAGGRGRLEVALRPFAEPDSAGEIGGGNPVQAPGGLEFDPNDNVLFFTPAGDAPDASDPGLTFVALSVGDARTGEPPRILAFRIDDVASNLTRLIERIEIERLSVLEGSLVSARNRVFTVPDENFPTNGRSDLALSAVYRVAPSSDSTQIAVFSYDVRGGPPGSLFVADESSEDASPLGVVQLTLRYDADRQRYTVRGSAANEAVRDALVNGQVLLAQRGPNVGDAGADLPSVVNRVRRLGNELVAEIDRVPRIDGRSMLPTLGSQASIPFFYVKSSAFSAFDDSEWLLEPRNVRVIQLQ